MFRALAATIVCVVCAHSAPVAAQDRGPQPPPSAESRPVLLAEPRRMTTAMDFVEKRMPGTAEGTPSDGFYVDTGHMITGAGWISAGPGFRRSFGNGRVLFDASAALSWRTYKVAQTGVEVSDVGRKGVTVGSQLLWQDMTQITYFGAGEHSREDARSEYRLKTTNAIGYASYKPRPWLTAEARVGIIANPDLAAPAGPFQGKHPDARMVFPGDPGMTLGDPPSFAHGDLSLVADTRDHPGYPMRGGVYRTAWTRFIDRNDGVFTFDRFEVEATHFVPILDGLSVLALRGWTVLTPSSQNVPFYLMPSLGGDSTLRAYLNYRLHERNMALVNAESRWALSRHVDGAIFAGAGNVAARAGDLDFSRVSWGVGLRLHTRTTTLARVDVAHGTEGWHVLLRLNDPLRLKRLERRHALMPFVP